MKHQEVRQKFISFFEQQGHKSVASGPLVPLDDPTLLFTNAGMNQFKNIFTGEAPRPTPPTAVSIQKCIRAGGKHNDLDNVGFTARHHTFFEMMGNFSFGDYFKEQAIILAWELVTKVYGLDPKRLYVTTYKDDDEADLLWKKLGIPNDHRARFGQKDNYWRMGESGPCGPCSEIFYDLGDKVPGPASENVLGGEGDRFMEIYNLVFMQFYEDENANQTPLPSPSIDTGLGFERLVSVLQNKINNYDTDLFAPMIETGLGALGRSRSSLSTEELSALRVISDHSRTTAFLMTEQVYPGATSRNYVLRRIMRRAIRYSKKLGHPDLLSQMTQSLIESFHSSHPELLKCKTDILESVKNEETQFLKTLTTGESLLMGEIEKLKKSKQKVLSGEVAFKLYDTYGFPADVTGIVAEEHGLKIDTPAFEKELQLAKERSKSSRKSTSPDSLKNLKALITELPETKFLEDQFELKVPAGEFYLIQNDKIVSKAKFKKQSPVYLVSNTTPFYAESGGQISDTGLVQQGTTTAQVTNCFKIQNRHIHELGEFLGELKLETEIKLGIESKKRFLITCHHSATHLLHGVLRKQLGENTTQAGSLVTDKKLRFDFKHKGALTQKQISEIENNVNAQIFEGSKAHIQVQNYEEAIKSGALALFGETYAEKVRSIKFNKDSHELCGGCHVKNTRDIGLFKILSESAVSQGIRRIEAVTSEAAFKYLESYQTHYLEAKAALTKSASPKPESLLETIAKIKAELKQLKLKPKSETPTEALKLEELSPGIEWAYKDFIETSKEAVGEILDRTRNKMKDGIVAITLKNEGKLSLLIGVTANLKKKFPAGSFFKQLPKDFEARGGGRPDFAQGGVSKVKGLESELKKLLV